MGESVSLFREPDAGNLPVRFEEREQETEPSQTGLRWRGESHVEYPPGDYSYCACSRLYSRYHSSYERGCQAKTLLHSLRETSIGACIQAPSSSWRGFGFNAWSGTEYDRDTDHSCWSPLSGFMRRSRHHPMREDVKQKHFSTLSVRPRSVLASRPLLLRGEDLVLTPGAAQSTTGIRITVAGLPGVVSCDGPDTIRCEAVQANRWLKCQPSSYGRLEAYGFFGLCEGA